MDKDKVFQRKKLQCKACKKWFSYIRKHIGQVDSCRIAYETIPDLINHMVEIKIIGNSRRYHQQNNWRDKK